MGERWTVTWYDADHDGSWNPLTVQLWGEAHRFIDEYQISITIPPYELRQCKFSNTRKIVRLVMPQDWQDNLSLTYLGVTAVVHFGGGLHYIATAEAFRNEGRINLKKWEVHE